MGPYRPHPAEQHELAGSATRAALFETIRRAAGSRDDPAISALDTLVSLDDGTGNPLLLRLKRGQLSLASHTKKRHVETTIHSDPLTLVSVIRGHLSGVDAFLRGRLRVRGNLSLALKLDGLFDRRTRRSERPRPARVTADGIDTFYIDAGEGPPVILLHGLGATNASMLPAFSALSKRYRVIAPDLPGFGDSEKPIARYDAAFFARWLENFMRELRLAPAHLVGNSMGGRIAIETALRSPDSVSRLALLAPSLAFKRFRQLVPIVRGLSPELAAVPMPASRAQIRHTLRFLFSDPSRIKKGWYEAAVDEFLRVFKTAPGRIAFFSAAREIYLERPYGREGFWPRLGRLSCPALFLWGDRDRMVPWRFHRHVERVLPQASSLVLTDCGHIPQFEHPDRTVTLLRRFFEEKPTFRSEQARG